MHDRKDDAEHDGDKVRVTWKFSNVISIVILQSKCRDELTFENLYHPRDPPEIPESRRCSLCCSVLQCVAVFYSVLQCVTVCYSVLQYVAVCHMVQKCQKVIAVACVAGCCSVLQCITIRCSVPDPSEMPKSGRCNLAEIQKNIQLLIDLLYKITIELTFEKFYTHKHTHTHTHTHAHAHAHAHAHTHTRTHTVYVTIDNTAMAVGYSDDYPS